MQLRGVGKAVRPDCHQLGILCRHREKLVLRGHKALMTKIAVVLQLEIEPARLTQARYGRGNQRKNLGVANFGERRHRPLHDGGRAVLRARTLAPILQENKGEADILAGADEAEAADAEHMRHVGFLIHQKMMLYLLRNGDSARLLRAHRKGELREDVALVLLGQKARRQHEKQHAENDDDDHVNPQRDFRAGDHLAQR